MKRWAWWLMVFAGGLAQAENDTALMEKSFVILRSTPKYAEAKSGAEEASKALGVKLDLRGLAEDKKTGLTFSRKSCMEGPMQEFPCYWSRGKNDDGEYLSVEYSSAYKDMKPGLYVVVAYSGAKKEASPVLKKILAKYKDAYTKIVHIYMAGE